MEFLNLIEQYRSREDFKPFTDQPTQKLAAPVRKTVIAAALIMANCYELPKDQRYKYASMAGLTPKDTSNAEALTFDLEDKYSLFKAQEELAKVLFPAVASPDFDNLNESELNIASAVFFMRRRGI